MDRVSDMMASYPEFHINGRGTLSHIAQKLWHARPLPSRLSPLIFMTDPVRVQNIEASLNRLPLGATLIYRHFGADDRADMAIKLRQLTFARDQQFLIGNDPELAIRSGADGVHFRRDPYLTAPQLWRQRCPAWVISMAGIKSGDYMSDYTGDLSVLDGLVVSSVFESQSPSAGTPIGVEKFQALCRQLPVPIFALGGINAHTAPQLLGSGAAGLATVSAI